MSENLIIKYLTGELSEKESEKLLDWVSKDDHNKKYFSEIKNTWASAGVDDLPSNESINKEAELFNYRRVLQNVPKKQTYRIKTISLEKKSIWNLALKIAAVIVLIYSLGITSYIFLIPKQSQYNEVITRNGEKSQLTLSDGSKIWVNSNTKVRYPVDLNQKQVDIYLEGEAFFDVYKIPGRNLSVHTSDLMINVLGTAFNVKSYSDDGITETTLVRGKITIDGQGKKLKEKLILKPNQQATYISSHKEMMVKELNTEEKTTKKSKNKIIKNTEQLHKKQPKAQLVFTEKVETEIYTSWKDGKLVFKGERFEDLARRMERWYDVKIQINDSTLKESRYTGTFEKESVEQALRALSLSLPFTYEIDQNEIIITSRK